MFGSDNHGIDREKAVAETWLVNLDYRPVTNIQERIFASQVDLNHLLDFIKYG
jgi:hypothetical protein